MQHDTQLVSILYRTHKSLPSASKVNSLYAFDALARAARGHATKANLDAHSHVGNAASFLVKMEGVLDGLVQDLVSLQTQEAKVSTFGHFYSTSASLSVAARTAIKEQRHAPTGTTPYQSSCWSDVGCLYSGYLRWLVPALQWCYRWIGAVNLPVHELSHETPSIKTCLT